MLIGRRPELGLGGGSSYSLPGSGIAVPSGIEAVFEYDDLILNNRAVVDKYRITEIDGLHDADVRDAREANPGYHGETAFDSHYSGRTVTLSGRIEAYNLSKLRDMQQGLRQAFGELVEKPLKFRTGDPEHDHYIMCRKSAPLSMREAQTDGVRFFREFQITLRASNPRFLSNRLVYESHPHTGTTEFTVTNNGNFTSQPLIRLHNMTDPVVTNLEIGEALVMEDLVLDLNEYVEMDVSKTTVRHSDGTNAFNHMALSSEWVDLPPGNSTIRIESAAHGANARVEVLYRHTWM